MYPTSLQPTALESFKFSADQTIKIPKTKPLFDLWTGGLPADTYNNKPVLNFEGEFVFAEIAVLRIFQKEGWNGVWVDTYRRKYRNGYWGENTVVSLPEDKQEILDGIYNLAGNKSGCWDVFCWKGEKIVFAESKWHLKDKIRPSQIKWLNAALKYGLKEDSFLIVEWDYTN